MTLTYTADAIRKRLRAIQEPVTVGDITKAVTGDPSGSAIAPAFLQLAELAAGRPLVTEPPSSSFLANFMKGFC